MTSHKFLTCAEIKNLDDDCLRIAEKRYRVGLAIQQREVASAQRVHVKIQGEIRRRKRAAKQTLTERGLKNE